MLYDSPGNVDNRFFLIAGINPGCAFLIIMKKPHLPSWLKNKYVIATAFFLLWICLFNDIDLFYVIRSRSEVKDLQSEVLALEKQNDQALKALHELSSSKRMLEKFARETYYMK